MCLFFINVFRLSFKYLPFINVVVYRHSLRFVEYTASDCIDFGDYESWGKQSTERSLSTTT